MTPLQRFLKHERRYASLGIIAILFVNANIIATSILIETQRAGSVIPTYQPFVTEYSSHLAVIACIPLLAWAADRFRILGPKPWQGLLGHLAISVVYSLLHIGIFVAIRKLVFAGLGDDYQYSDNLLLSFVYEYRKDLWAYSTWIVLIHGYRFVISRLRGEAVPIEESEDQPASETVVPDRFLVRKLGREFLVKVADIEWLEAAGNYVNLHVGERTYPLRATMGDLHQTLLKRGFVRIHRSYGVNLEFVDSLQTQDSGDGVVTLKNGQALSLSRRYREGFRDQFGG